MLRSIKAKRKGSWEILQLKRSSEKHTLQEYFQSCLSVAWEEVGLPTELHISTVYGTINY